MAVEETNALSHYGVKGMHWGERNYQYKDGTYTDLGKKRRRVGYIREEAAKKEEEKSKSTASTTTTTTTTETPEGADEKFSGKAYKDMTRKELRAAKKRARHNEAARREQREFNRDKKQAIDEGDLSFISKNISRFSNEEIDDAVTRYRKMQSLKDLEKANRKDADYYIDKATHFLEKGSKATKAFTDIVNNINDMQTKSANRKKAQVEYEYTKDPSKRPLTEKDKSEILKNQEQARSTGELANKNRELARQEKEIADQKHYETLAKKREHDEAERLVDEAKRERKEAERLAKEAKEKAKEAADRATKNELEWQAAVYEEQVKAKKAAEKLAERQADEAKKLAKQAKKDEKETLRQQEIYEKAAKKAEEENKRIQKELAEEQKRFNDENVKQLAEKWKADKEAKENNYYTNKLMKDRANEEQRERDSYWNWGVFSGKPGSKSKSESNSSSDSSSDINERDRKWARQLRNNPGDSRQIDKWVKEMKQKYIKERGMSTAAAEEKAEEYVDYWLDRYDAGDFDKKKKK